MARPKRKPGTDAVDDVISGGYSPNIPVPDFKKLITCPTKYKPAMCQVVLNIMAQGRSKKRVAVELQINETTLHRWRNDHPEFGEALAVGTLLCQVAWEQMCLDETCGVPGVNVSTGGVMAMRNMLKWDTRDKEEKQDIVAEAAAILKLGASLNNDDWLKVYGPTAAKQIAK